MMAEAKNSNSKRCKYHLTIPAEENNEQQQQCEKKYTITVSAGTNSYRLIALDFCKEHYEKMDIQLGLPETNRIK
jgi:hypothetical protein